MKRRCRPSGTAQPNDTTGDGLVRVGGFDDLEAAVLDHGGDA